MSMLFFEGGSYRVSLKTLFCDSWSTLGFGMIQRAGYQSKNIVNILFWLDIPFWNWIFWRSSLWLLPAWELQYWSPTLKAAALAVAVLRETHPLLGPPWVRQNGIEMGKWVKRSAINRKQIIDNVFDWYHALWSNPEPPVEQESQK